MYWSTTRILLITHRLIHTYTDQGMDPHTVGVDFISAENAIRYTAATYYYKD